MSNPVINRLGKNQFWYNSFNPKENYIKNNQVNQVIPSLIQNYLNYSISWDYNLMYDAYWYGKHRKHAVYTKNTFFKKVFFSNTILGIEHSYQIRLTISEYFPFRFWILKYNNWLIIFTSWFKPYKKSGMNAISDKVKHQKYYVSPKQDGNKNIKSLNLRNHVHSTSRLTYNYCF